MVSLALGLMCGGGRAMLKGSVPGRYATGSILMVVIGMIRIGVAQ